MLIGRVGGREYGLRLLMDVLEDHDLVGEFFVEPLCTYKLGLAPLRDLCLEMLERGHGVSLHLHPGWKAGLTAPPTRLSDMMYDYDVEAQEGLLREGIDLLRDCGVERVRAFRAGNLGGDARTYEAMRRVGIRISSNYCAGWNREMPGRYGLSRATNDATRLDDIWEFPITSFRDFPLLRPGHLRPLQIAAASRGELARVVEQAIARRMHAVVVLLHSFELIRRDGSGHWAVDWKHVRRFQALCEILADRADRIATCRFDDIEREGFTGLGEAPEPGPGFPGSTDLAGGARWISHAISRIGGPSRIFGC